MTTKPLTYHAGFRWNMLGLLFTVQTCTSLVVLSFGALAPFIQEDLHLTRAQVGMFISAGYLGYVVVGWLCGWLVDRWGIRRFLLFGPVVIGIFFIAFTRTNVFWLALPLVFLGGLGYVFINPCAAKALAFWFPPESRATAIGIMKSGVNAGTAAGAAVLPGLSLALGWRNALGIAAMSALVIGIAGSTLYRDPPSLMSAGARGPGLSGFRRVMTNRNVWLIGSTAMTYGMTQFALTTYLVLFLKEEASLPVVAAGMALTIAALSGAAGRVLWGVISDRAFGGQRIRVLSIIGLVSGTMAITLALTIAVVPSWLLYIMLAVFGFAAIGWNGVQLTALAEIGGKEQAATVVGFGLMIGALGPVLGPPIFGHIVDTTQSYSLAWVIAGLVTVTGSALTLLVKEERS